MYYVSYNISYFIQCNAQNAALSDKIFFHEQANEILKVSNLRSRCTKMELENLKRFAKTFITPPRSYRAPLVPLSSTDLPRAFRRTFKELPKRLRFNDGFFLNLPRTIIVFGFDFKQNVLH